MEEWNNGHIFIWSGVAKNERAAAGVGCLIHERLKNKINDWEAISERILKIQLKYTTHTKTILAIYGPNEDEKADKKDTFWEELSMEMETARGTIFVLGDFNGRVGKKDSKYNTVIGTHGENTRNNNGRRLLDFCINHDMIITNTFYEHKQIHKYTRAEPSRGEKSIIDYVIVERNNRHAIMDVRVKRGYEIGSDHFLLVAKVKNLEKENNRNRLKYTRKIDYETIKSYKLKERKFASKFEHLIEEKCIEKMENMENSTLEELWKIFKNIILDTAKEVCGTCKTNNHRKQTAWWTEEIKQEIKIKKRKWNLYLNSNTALNHQIYKEQNKTVKKLVREAKEESWKEFGTKLEYDSRGNQKLFYRALKTLRSDKRTETTAIKDADGGILTGDKDIMNRWREHFQGLLDTGEMTEQKNIGREEDDIDSIKNDKEDNITYEELKEAIKRLKNGKAPGEDKITTEMAKNMGEKGTCMLLEIMNRAWREEKVPNEWQLGLIVPIYKAGDSKICNNYRGVTLLSTVTKLYERILENRLRNIVDPSLTQSQSGFRKGRSTMDHVFTIKEIITKAQNRGEDIYMGFVDLEKAFDRLPRTKIWECLHNNKSINHKLINCIKSLYTKTKNCVIYKNMRSENFATNEGVRQGGVLSPLLFIMVMDEIIKEAKKQAKPLYVGYHNLEKVGITECVFADDVAIITSSEKNLQYNLNIWNELLTEKGMTMNKNKTKVMVVSRNEQSIHIRVGETEVEQVEIYKYLGVNIDQRGTQEVEINERIRKANNLYYAINHTFINKKEISKHTKMSVFKAVYRPVLTYGCEAWVLTKNEKSKLQAAEMKYLRRSIGVTKMDKVRNEVIRSELKTESIQQFIEKRQLGWLGHLHRMNNEVPAKRVWEAKTMKKRRRGRPRETWDNAIGKILKHKKITWKEAKEKSKNRKDWKIFVNSA
jgi:Reverse transcriptase (RNA-dependent DNA polymerase)/Endonuclease-reverse transcriptase